MKITVEFDSLAEFDAFKGTGSTPASAPAAAPRAAAPAPAPNGTPAPAPAPSTATPAPAPAPAPAPSPAPAPAASPSSGGDLAGHLQNYAKAFGPKTAKAKLAELGYTKVSDVPPEQIAYVISQTPLQ